MTELTQSKKEIKKLRQVCREAYQAVGMLAGLVPDKQLHKALDNLGCAARGGTIPHKTFLPLTMKEPEKRTWG